MGSDARHDDKTIRWDSLKMRYAYVNEQLKAAMPAGRPRGYAIM